MCMNIGTIDFRPKGRYLGLIRTAATTTLLRADDRSMVSDSTFTTLDPARNEAM